MNENGDAEVQHEIEKCQEENHEKGKVVEEMVCRQEVSFLFFQQKSLSHAI